MLINNKLALNDAFDEFSETVKEEYQDLIKRSTLTVLGQGIIGNIVSDQMNIDYGAVLINTDNEKEFRITNPSKCDINYNIKIYKVNKIVLSEEEKKKITLKRQEKIRKKIIEEEKRKKELENKENNPNDNNNNMGDDERTKIEGTNNENLINTDVFDFSNKNNNTNELDENMDYLNEKDYEKEELVDEKNTGMYFFS